MKIVLAVAQLPAKPAIVATLVALATAMLVVRMTMMLRLMIAKLNSRDKKMKKPLVKYFH